MLYTKEIKAIGLLVASIGFLIMMGWFFDIAALKAFIPGQPEINFFSAFFFFISGVALWSTSMYFDEKDSLAIIILPICALVIMLFMGTFIASSFFGVNTGISELFVEDSVGTFETNVEAQPSIGLMIGFIVVAILSMVTLIFQTIRSRYYTVCGGIILGIAIIAMMGYVFHEPALYYDIEGVSSAIAIHSAVLFSFLGIGFIMQGMSKSLDDPEV